MELKSGLSVAIMSAVFVSQLILHTEAQTGAARTTRAITFDCNPEQLHGAARLTCREACSKRPTSLRRRDVPGQRPDVCHAFMRQVPARSHRRTREASGGKTADPVLRGRRSGRRCGRGRPGSPSTRPSASTSRFPARQARERSGGDERHAPGTPTTRNTPSLQPCSCTDGRNIDARAQALGAVHAHAQNGIEADATAARIDRRVSDEHRRVSSHRCRSSCLLTEGAAAPAAEWRHGIREARASVSQARRN